MLSLKVMRYSNEVIGRIWSEEAITTSRINIEQRWLASLASVNMVAEPPTINTGYVLMRSIEIERTTNHDVASMIIAIEEDLIRQGYSNHSMVHFGLTSSDICDTALSLAYKQSFTFLEHELRKLIRTMSLGKEDLVTARTHGADTGLRIPISTRMTKMALELSDVLEGITSLKFYGKLSGPIGQSDAFDMHRTCEAYVLSDLCLDTHWATTQVIPRHVYADYQVKLAILGKILSRIANSIRLAVLAGDIILPKVKNEVGSSSMPHKVNPWQLERVVGMSRMLDSHAMAALSNIDLWLERDISHSCVERDNPQQSFNYLLLMMKDITSYVNRISVVNKPLPPFDPYHAANKRVLENPAKTREECHREVEDETIRYFCA
jgi:adenylosuccinate lyase